ncbi:Autophagy protein 5 [Hypoxylon texense]
MEPGPPETKRPRLLQTGPSWSSHQAVSLPHPTAAHHSPASGPHHPAPSPYQHPPPFSSRPPEPPLPPAHHHLDDRRHHEHDPYPPMHDPHRQPPLPPSSAHPSFPSYPPRDPVVKRDPGDENSLPQLRRPNSTGNVQDSLPPAPHGPPHQNGPPPDDPRRHMGYENGPSMPHSPAMYRPPPQNYHPPPTPVAQHPQYDSPHVYGPPTMYPTLEIATSAKRKAQRASQVVAPSNEQLLPDKVTADLLEMLSSMRDELNSKLTSINDELTGLRQANLNQTQRMVNLETKVKQLNSGTDMKVESIEEEHPSFDGSPIPMNKAQGEESLSSPGGTVVEPSLTMDEAHATLQEANDDDMEANPGPLVTPGKPAMPLNHTTLAGLLLKWPSIERMVHHLMEAEKIFHPDEYPVRQEQARGMLRVFGRGEGFDQDIRASEKETPPDHTMTDVLDDCSDVASPSPMGEAWGQVGSLTPPPGVEYRGGVVNVEGNPDWDPNKIWRYVQSFKDNILNMHPIIIPKELTAMVKVFLDTLPKSQNTFGGKTGAARFVNQPSAIPPSFSETGTKRKRSPAADEPNPSASFLKPGRPYRSVHSALVLLVFALGKICLHKDRIPDAVHESDSPMHHSPSVRNGILASPLQGSPPGLLSQSRSSDMASPKESERIPMSRRPSFQGNASTSRGHSHRRNLDTVPGLEYFALATDIIGSHAGGFNLKHIYVFILAGLYHGQLGRVLESWSYISLASRNLQVILRPSLDRLSKWHDQGKSIGQSRRDNQLAFAFWTCLQLESDILAELPLPQSGILQYEDRMPYPNSEYAVNQGFSEHIVTGYIAQLYLRKQLNQVHTLLYDSEKQSRHRNGITLDDPALEEGIRGIEEMLRNSRNRWVPSSYQWDDNDLPANDILGARLRAKYWGSQVILYRPFLRAILDREPYPYSNQAGSPENQRAIDLEEGLPGVDPKIVHYARLAIDALVESTRAFHGIPSSQRIIITNVFGTAHARFIDEQTLGSLFIRTISFFQTIALPSSALKADMNILIGLAKDLGLIRDEFDVPGSSFSSISSSGPLPPMHNPSDNFHPPPLSTLGRPHLPPPAHSMP